MLDSGKQFFFQVLCGVLRTDVDPRAKFEICSAGRRQHKKFKEGFAKFNSFTVSHTHCNAPISSLTHFLFTAGGRSLTADGVSVTQYCVIV